MGFCNTKADINFSSWSVSKELKVNKVRFELVGHYMKLTMADDRIINTDFCGYIDVIYKIINCNKQKLYVFNDKKGHRTLNGRPISM